MPTAPTHSHADSSTRKTVHLASRNYVWLMSNFRDSLSPEEEPAPKEAVVFEPQDVEVEAPALPPEAPGFDTSNEEDFSIDGAEDAQISDFRSTDSKQSTASEKFLNPKRQRMIAAFVVIGLFMLLIIIMGASGSPEPKYTPPPLIAEPTGGGATVSTGTNNSKYKGKKDDSDAIKHSDGSPYAKQIAAANAKAKAAIDAAPIPSQAEIASGKALLNNAAIVVKAYDRQNAIPKDPATFARVLEKYGDLGVRVTAKGKPAAGQLYVRAIPTSGIALLMTSTETVTYPVTLQIKIKKRIQR